MTVSAIAPLIVCSWLLGQEPSDRQGRAPTAEEIEQAVIDLGSDLFERRQAASRLLWRAGRDAMDAVRRATKSEDPEVALRARRIYENFKYGIFPDTPPAARVLLRQFRDGDENVKRKAFEQLVADRFLQLPQLTADGRLGHVESLAGPRNTAFASDSPEVQEVVVVEPIHVGNHI